MPRKSSWTEYLLVLGRREPRLFFVAGFVSNLGSYLTALAIPLAVYRMTGSVSALSSAWLVRIAVSVVCLPVAGVFADRQDRRSILVVCNLTSVVADLLLLLGFHIANLAMIFAGVALLQAADRFYGPSARAAFPGFFHREELPVANGLREISGRVVDSLAPAIGGWLAEFFGVSLLFILDAASFLCATLLITSMRFGTEHLREGSTPRSMRDFFAAVSEGVQQALSSVPVVVYLVTGVAGAATARLFDIMGVYITQEVLGLGPRGLGYIYSFGALASFVALIVIPRLNLHRLSFRVYGLLEVLSGSLMVMFALSHVPVQAYTSVLLRSGVDTVSGVMLDTEVQKVIRSHHLGRVSSIIFLSYVIGSLVGIGLTSAFGTEHRLAAFTLLAGLSCIIGVWVVVIYSRAAGVPRDA